MATALVVVGLIAALTFVLRLVRRAYFSPLSRIPNGHVTAPLSRAWMLWLKYTRQETTVRRRLHQRLGPVVRMGPNDLSIDCIDHGVRTVYGGGFEKPLWYSREFWNYGVPPLFATRSTADHTERRQAMTGVYTKSYILKSAELRDIVANVIGVNVAQRLAEWASSGASVDVLHWTKAVVLDIVSAYSFGAENGLNLVQQKSKQDMTVGNFERMMGSGFIRTEFSELTEYLPHVSAWTVPKAAKQARAAVEGLVRELYQAATSSSCVVSHLRSRLSSNKALTPLVERQIQSEILDHMIAGNEGISITLSFLMHALSQNPSWQSKLRNELRAFDTTSPSAAADLDALPLLEATLAETLRVRPAAKGPFPRVVPPKGARIGPFTDVPGGTIVSASPYLLGLHAEVFGPRDPEVWAPERWLEADAAQRAEMRRWLWTFGSGSRGCAGVHLATHVMKSFTAAVYRDYTTVVVVHEGCEQVDTNIAPPASGKMILRFEKV